MTIVPYCTHEGSGIGRSERDMQKLCPGAKVLSGLAICWQGGRGFGKLAEETWPDTVTMPGSLT